MNILCTPMKAFIIITVNRISWDRASLHDGVKVQCLVSSSRPISCLIGEEVGVTNEQNNVLLPVSCCLL